MDVHYPQYPAFQQLTSNNRGPAVVVVSYILLVVTIVLVKTTLIMRFKAAKELVSGDWMILGSMLLSIGQTIAVTFAANAGLGRHRASLTESSFHSFEKAFYASEVLAVPTLALAKASAVFLIIQIWRVGTVKPVSYGLLAIVGTGALAAVVALIFQCAPPDTWDYEGQCIDQRALYIANAMWNILTDVAIVIIPVLQVRNVQTTASTRLLLGFLFACRLLVPPVAIAGLVTLQPVYTGKSPDETWERVLGVMLSQAMICLSIITACVPTIKRFVADIASGMTAVQISRPLELAMKSDFVSQAKRGCHHQNTSPRNHRGLDSGRGVSHKSVVERSESAKGLTDDVIWQTIDYDVHSEFEQDITSSTHDGFDFQFSSNNGSTGGGLQETGNMTSGEHK